MIFGKSHILASAESLTTTASYPANRWNVGDFATEVTYYIDVQSVTGSPSAASLTAKVQGVLPHTTGNQFISERLFDFDAEQARALTAEGLAWPTQLANQATSFPVTFQRTYRGFGKGLRLVLTPSFTGGTTPAFVVTVIAHTKG